MNTESFFDQVSEVVGSRAAVKGYGGQDWESGLYSFVHQHIAEEGHAIGEIIYKAVRYNNKRSPEDLVKIAAWAFLIWHHDRKQKEKEIANAQNKAELGVPFAD